MNTKLYVDIGNDQWPIIYRQEYNVTFMGFESLHPFDTKKWGNIYRFLEKAGLVNKRIITEPNEATKSDLQQIHTKKYLKSLNCSYEVAKIAEVCLLALVPNYLINRSYLRPMRFQTGGSILAGKLALERGWAINLGGGFHHCCKNKGEGFCVYADITLLTHFVFHHFENIKKVMIVDLDAHQGNGYEKDFQDNPNIYILDVYNKNIFPCDKVAKRFINKKVELQNDTKDPEYLEKVTDNLNNALLEFSPQLLIYNAGTDILKGDPLGGLAITEEGIMKRDELVFQLTHKNKIPIVMLTSGGYLKKTAKIIANSIINLYNIGLINGPAV